VLQIYFDIIYVKDKKYYDKKLLVPAYLYSDENIVQNNFVDEKKKKGGSS